MTLTIIDRTVSPATPMAYNAPFALTLSDALEEALYVLQELTPVDRDWVRQLRQGMTQFSYHGENYLIVKADAHTFEIQDIR